MGLEFDTWMRRMACEKGLIDPFEAGGVCGVCEACEACEISRVDRRGRYQGQRRVAPRQV